MSSTTHTLAGKSVLVTGGTRGIGRAIALRCARDGASVAVLGRSADSSAVADEISAAGGRGLALTCDMGNDAQVAASVARVAAEFGGIFVLVNNATVLVLKRTSELTMAEYDLMSTTNARGAFAAAKYALPHLRRSANAHILTLCPQPQLEARWFEHNMAYTASKFAMGLMAFGLAAEQRANGIASNALWPYTTIATDGLAECGNAELQARPRTPEIMADAAYRIVTQPAAEFSGNFCLDEVVLREAGVRDFDRYSAVPGTPQGDLSRDHLVSAEQLARLHELQGN
ncbi:hypothetical protein GGF37_005101 [Kickxella alabastrina]|nr:hypothetical protein GGF37_005101 [Kickxella alabastrina]